MGLRVHSLALLGGLRIWHCHELWSRLQTQLRSCVAVALTALIWPLAWEPPYGTGAAQEKAEGQKKKKKKESLLTTSTHLLVCKKMPLTYFSAYLKLFFFWGYNILYFQFPTSQQTHVYVYIHLTHMVINIHLEHVNWQISVWNISRAWDSHTLSLVWFQVPVCLGPQGNGLTKHHTNSQ